MQNHHSHESRKRTILPYRLVSFRVHGKKKVHDLSCRSVGHFHQVFLSPFWIGGSDGFRLQKRRSMFIGLKSHIGESLVLSSRSPKSRTRDCHGKKATRQPNGLATCMRDAFGTHACMACSGVKRWLLVTDRMDMGGCVRDA